MTRPPPEEIAAAILRVAGERGPRKTICPSEVARALGGEEWRPLMTPVRNAAVALAREGRLEVLRKGKPAELDPLRGVIRLRIVPG
ncbi:DUF3253 domain-containing protein [Roseomonas sp. BN140053]|uniref:DUF3253 domain-containing protein n=1 Tax=Roseomonas sp. BN140053 TaxID=3391898 RepID=UPI0039E75FDB